MLGPKRANRADGPTSRFFDYMVVNTRAWGVLVTFKTRSSVRVASDFGLTVRAELKARAALVAKVEGRAAMSVSGG